jgi:nitrous oxide reductase accessory protein NosL
MKPGAAVWVAAGLACVSACRRAELSGPPTLRPGRDECAECGMLLAEDRCAGALLVTADGERAHLVFDDIGCMLHYGDEPGRPAAVEAYVRDYGAREWVRSRDAWFVAGGASMPQTPMGSGIVAFASREGAESMKTQSGGEVFDDAGLRARRRAEGTGR